jgi:hypothetical protein
MNDLKTGLMSVDGDELIAIGRRIVGDNDYSDEDLNVKFAGMRKRYPAYDAICRLIQNDDQPIEEEALIHASGLEMMLRSLITMAEERENGDGKAVQA